MKEIIISMNFNGFSLDVNNKKTQYISKKSTSVVFKSFLLQFDDLFFMNEFKFVHG